MPVDLVVADMSLVSDCDGFDTGLGARVHQGCFDGWMYGIRCMGVMDHTLRLTLLRRSV